MRRFRRLCHRLRISRKAKDLADCSTNGETGDRVQQADEAIAIEPILATERCGEDTAKAIWLDAYTKLQEEEGTRKMVEAYEIILMDQLDGGMGQNDGNVTNGNLGVRKPEEMIPDMRKVTEAVLDKASRHHDKKQGFIKAAKIINTISSTVIKPMLQTEAVASMAWAGVCVALEFSIRATTASLDMVDGLSHVAKRMEWYMLLYALLLDSAPSSNSGDQGRQSELRDQLRINIQELYYSLLTYEVQCVCYCYRESKITKALRALVTYDDWKAKLNEIKELESRIQMDMSQFEHVQTKDRLSRIAENAEETFQGIDRTLQRLVEAQEQTFSKQEIRHLQGIVGKFSTSDYNKQMKLNPNRVSGTCEWFCRHKNFMEWLEKDFGLLLVSADPGCGKSTLTRYLIEEVLPQHTAEGKLVYFFFKDTHEQKKLATAMCAILHQLLLDDNALVSNAEKDIAQAGEKLTESSSSLWKVFLAACQNHSNGIICVLDALDECDPNDCPELVQNIKEMLGIRPKIRFLVTTRGYPHILNRFNSYETGLIHLDGDGKIEKDAIQQEIGLVFDYKLEQLFRGKNLDHQPERKAAIENALRSKGSEQRTYMWLKLIFDLMERIPWMSDKDWKKLIESPPQNVNDAYATLLEKVPKGHEGSVNILLHLMVAAYRPLTLHEMSIALNVRDNLGAHDEKDLGLQPDTQFKQWIIHMCGFFVTIYDSQLYFIHQTAKEFLAKTEPETSWPEGLDWLSPVIDLPAHKVMAESAIAYLSLKCFNSKRFYERALAYRSNADNRGWSHRVSLNKDYGFLDYTTRFWAKHFKLCQSFDGASLKDVDDAFIPQYDSLFTTSDCCAPAWILLNPGYPDDHARIDRSQSPSHMGLSLVESYNVCDVALWFDHARLLVHSLHHIAKSRAYPLHTALGLDSANCVRYLAATGFDIDIQDESGATALSFVASHGIMDAVNVLLDHNADVSIGAAPDELPLSYIIKQNFGVPYGDDYSIDAPAKPELVRRLIRQGGNLNDARVKLLGGAGTMVPLAWASTIPSHTFANLNDTMRLDRWIREALIASDLDDVADLLQNLNLFAADTFLDAYNRSLIKFLLDHGAEIDGIVTDRPPEGYHDPVPVTALELACLHASEEGSSQVFWNAMFLIHAGADTGIIAETGHSILDWLLRARVDRYDWGRWEVLTVLLLKHKSPLDYINNPVSEISLQTRLHWLTDSYLGKHTYGLEEVSYGPEKVKLLLDHGAEVNCQDACGKTPMHFLVSHIFDESEICTVIKILIAKGAHLEVQDSLGRTPVHYVRSSVVLDMLVANGVNIEARDHRGNTPLQTMLANYDGVSGAEVIQSLAVIGADLTVINLDGETLLHAAAKSGFAEGLSYLVHAETNLDVTDGSGATPLQVALSYRSLKAAAWILSRGAVAEPLLQPSFDTEQLDRFTGATLLAFASASHDNQLVSILLRRGADPNAYPWVGAADVERYLHRADFIQVNQKWFSEAGILEGGKSKFPNAPRHGYSDYGNERPLHLAMHNRWTGDAESTIDLLLKHGADIEAKSRRGQTPLQVACHYGNEEGVRFLLEKGADVGCRAWNGDSALDLACTAWQPNARLVQALLAHGTISGFNYTDMPDLREIAMRWLDAAYYARDIEDSTDGYDSTSARANDSVDESESSGNENKEEEDSSSGIGESDRENMSGMTDDDKNNDASGGEPSDEQDDASSMSYALSDKQRASFRCRLTDHLYAVNSEASDLANLTVCQCWDCCRDHERRVCDVTHILLDAGAWTQVSIHLKDQDKLIRNTRERGWWLLSDLLGFGFGGRADSQRDWVPSNMRRSSLPATKPMRPFLDEAPVDDAASSERKTGSDSGSNGRCKSGSDPLHSHVPD